MKSLMIIPAKSNKTLPGYFDYLIQGYSYQPEKIDYRFNDIARPDYQNQFDYKAIESFEQYQPTDVIILHASDVYLNPDDLGNMWWFLQGHDDAYCIGLYPINDKWKHCTFRERPMYCTRIVIWKADIFRECLEEFKKMNNRHGMFYDENTRMAEIANKMGYRALVAKQARPVPIFEFEYKTMNG